MARKPNPNRPNTPISIEKTVKTELNYLRNKDESKNSNESDNKVIKRILKILREIKPELFHAEQKTTYGVKTSTS